MMNDDTNDTPEARPSPLAARRQPSKRASDMRGIGSVMVVCVVLFACLFGGIAGLNGFGSWAKANDAEATATAKSDDATATVMFAPTPETPEQRVQRLIKDAVYKGSVRQITVNADGVTIDMTGTAHSDLAEMRDGIYRDVLNIMARIF